MISEKTPKNSVETSDIISLAHEDIPELTNKDEVCKYFLIKIVMRI